MALRVEEEKPAEVVAAEAAVPAEPEVIKKGKKEEEGEEGAALADGTAAAGVIGAVAVRNAESEVPMMNVA